MADNIDILVKLFDTLKASADKNEDATQQLIGQQHELVNHIKNMPIKELHDALKEHSKDSNTNIDECSGTVTTTSGKLMAELNIISSKVSRMILVVAVAFSILTGTYVVIRTVSDDNSQFNKWVKTSEEAHNDILKEVKNQINNLRKEISDMPSNGG